MFTLNCKGRLMVIDSPMVMGVINTTPDSFYEGSRFAGTQAIVDQVGRMINDGADIIDVGGQSSRPQATLLSAQEEMDRVAPAVEAIHSAFPGALISIDSFYSAVAAECIRAGACIINDISSGQMDPEIMKVAAQHRVPYISMHMRGTPATMQSHTNYDNLLREVVDFFLLKLEACRAAGIHDVIVDPGFGFSKTIAQNFEMLQALDVFRILNRPILVGLSRKSTIYKTLGISAGESLNGTTVLNTVALLRGAHILRVHDVKEARQVVALLGELQPPARQ